MSLDELFTPEELAELEQWQADAYEITIEVPTSKLTDAQLDALFEAVGEAVDAWQRTIPERDWDAFVFGHGPAHRKQP